ncbi:MAG: ABC transporter transmembrane domain-containing protein [Rhodothalassiaceae bacterium]
MRQVWRIVSDLLGVDRSFFWLAIIYSMAISLLAIGLPVSVQMLIDTVANTSLRTPLVTLSVILFLLLLTSAILTGFRTHLMEIFGRRFFARFSKEMGLRAVYADPVHFARVDRGGLYNRFFDIMTVQRNIPDLLIGGFSLFFQTVIGFVVVSLYHPVLLFFNLVILGLIALIWIIWAPGAVRTALIESERKYESARWLEHVAHEAEAFSAEPAATRAFNVIEAHTDRWIDANKRHFRRTFAQSMALILLAAVASAVLLGIGGWLVIRGQLTLGQLVAAELIMSGVFAGLAQAGYYLISFYLLCAASEELSRITALPVKKLHATRRGLSGPPHLVLRNARLGKFCFDLTIPPGAMYLVHAQDRHVSRAFVRLARAVLPAEHGTVRFGEVDVNDLDPFWLKSRILLLDSRPFLHGRLRDLFAQAADNADLARVQDVLDSLSLDLGIASLDQDLSEIGWDMTTEEKLRLSLAAALLSDAPVLILSEIYDAVPVDILCQALAKWCQEPGRTCLYLTHRRAMSCFSHSLKLAADTQRLEPLQLEAAQ